MIRRTPIRRVSKKKAKADRIYSIRAKAFKEANPYCQAGLPPGTVQCDYYTSDVHHVFKRGKYHLVESTWLPVCRSCHRWITDHQGQARTLNLLK